MQGNKSTIIESPAMPLLPIICDRKAFGDMRSTASLIDGPDALLNAHVAMAKANQDCTREGILKSVWAISQKVQARVRGDQPQAIFAHMHDLMFDERGLIVVGAKQIQARHLYLPTAMESFHAGYSVACLIYKLVADRLGCSSWGTGIPGVGMFVTIVLRGVAMVVDVGNHGAIVTINELKKRADAVNVEWNDSFLSPLTNKAWITDTMQALLKCHSEKKDYSQTAALLEMEIALYPREIHLIRNLGMVLARLNHRMAGMVLNTYLSTYPEDPKTDAIKDLIRALDA